MANVLLFPTARAATTPLGLFLRVGAARYSQLATLNAERRVPIRRAFFDVSKLKHQLDFLKTLHDDRVELTPELAAGHRGSPIGTRRRRFAGTLNV